MKNLPSLAVGDRVRVMATATNQAAGLANLRGVVLAVRNKVRFDGGAGQHIRVQLRDRSEPSWFSSSELMKEEITAARQGGE